MILKTRLVSGSGVKRERLNGFDLTLVLPIGIFIFAAYLCKLSSDPRDVSIFDDSGLRAFPLYVRMDSETIPFL